MWRVAIFIAFVVAIPSSRACNFEYDPASLANYYRAEGWALPGTKDFNSVVTPQMYGASASQGIAGAVSQLLSHDEYPYVIVLPAQEFVVNGARKRMRSVQAKATIMRWRVNGHIVAYSYSLTPVVAQHVDGQWKIESETACIFTATFVDDKGDGVFRVLTPAAFSAELVPRWARRPSS